MVRKVERRKKIETIYKHAFVMLFLSGIAAVFFGLGIWWSHSKIAKASEIEEQVDRSPAARSKSRRGEKTVVYPPNTRLQFEGLGIEGELRNPGEFYFQHRVEEKFGSLIKRRPNFHRQMLRDAVMTK